MEQEDDTSERFYDIDYIPKIFSKKSLGNMWGNLFDINLDKLELFFGKKHSKMFQIIYPHPATSMCTMHYPFCIFFWKNILSFTLVFCQKNSASLSKFRDISSHDPMCIFGLTILRM